MVGKLFSCVICHLYIPVVDFSNWIVGFSIFNFGERCQSIFYIPDHSPLFGVCFANVFPRPPFELAAMLQFYLV